MSYACFAVDAYKGTVKPRGMCNLSFSKTAIGLHGFVVNDCAK